MDNMQEFMYCMGKLETMEFVGLAKLLKVELGKEDNKTEMRPFEDIMQDMLMAFKNSNRKKRRELLKILRSATKGRDYYHGPSSESEGPVAEQEDSRGESEEE